MASRDGAANGELRAQLIDLTRALIRVPSSAAHPSALERALELLRERLKPLAGVRIEEFRCEGVPSLVIRPAAVETPAVLLVGHIDVVDHGSRRHYRPRVRDGRIYGPGAGDMKGAVAIMVTLFGELLRRHPEMALGLAITADEELGSHHGTRYLVDQGLSCDLAILPDGGSIDTVVVAEKGLLHVEVVWRGASTHGAYPWSGNNPVDSMLSDLARLRDRFAALASDHSDHWHPTATFTTLESESKSINRVPEFARAGVDVRFTPPWTVATMLREIQSCLSPGAELSLPNVTESTRMAVDADYRDDQRTGARQPATGDAHPRSQRCALLLGARHPGHHQPSRGGQRAPRRRVDRHRLDAAVLPHPAHLHPPAPAPALNRRARSDKHCRRYPKPLAERPYLPNVQLPVAA